MRMQPARPLLARRQFGQVQLRFARADICVDEFQGGDIEIVLAAEIMIGQLLVDAPRALQCR